MGIMSKSNILYSIVNDTLMLHCRSFSSLCSNSIKHKIQGPAFVKHANLHFHKTSIPRNPSASGHPCGGCLTRGYPEKTLISTNSRLFGGLCTFKNKNSGLEVYNSSRYSHARYICRSTSKQRQESKYYEYVEDVETENSGWLIRLANENGYLSWCRNAYIGSITGATIQLQHIILYHKDVAFLFFFMSWLNLICGTGSYIYNIIKLHKKMKMSEPTAIYNISMALIHIVMWMGAMAIYLGYIEEDK